VSPRQSRGPEYPTWVYYPAHSRPPAWVDDLTSAVADARSQIDTATVRGLTSDAVLRALGPGLRTRGYQVEVGKRAGERVERPVLFGTNGHELVRYDVDAMHDQLGVVVEVEAGRGARGNAVYRDLIRASLIVDARYLALGVMADYRHLSGGREVRVASFAEARAILDAVYASGRLRLPFEGVLLFGYLRSRRRRPHLLGNRGYSQFHAVTRRSARS
jgi:hypothetical protein